jgi:hypothetical protein
MEYIQFVIKDYDKDALGIGNIFKCLISALRINPDTVIKCHKNYVYGHYDTVLDDKFIYTGETEKFIQPIYTCRLLLLREEEEYQQNIPSSEWYMNGLSNPEFHHYFSFTNQIDWNYDPTKIHERVQNAFFRSIDRIIFKPVIRNEVQSFLSKVSYPALGVSIRTWKSHHENGINRPYDSSIYKDKIKEVLQANPILSVILSIDNEEYLAPYLDVPNVIILRKPAHFNEIQYAVYKMLVLSHTNYFIGNRMSTFTELVFWFSKHTTKVYPVF